MAELATRIDRPVPLGPSGSVQADREAGPARGSSDLRRNGGGDGGLPLRQITGVTAEADGGLPLRQITGVTAEAAARGEQDIALEDVGGVRLLVSDVTAALLLLDEARYRAVHRLFGVSREQSWPVTLIALLLLAQATHDKSAQIRSGLGGPTRADAVLGAAALRELLIAIPGPSSRDTPFVGTLTMIAVLGAIARPGLRRAVHDIRASSHRVRVSFNHRYGHLLGSRRSRLTTPQER